MNIHPRLLAIRDQLSSRKVIKINIALGELNQVNEDQLRLQWNALVDKTPLAGADLEIRMIRAEHQCMACFQKYQPLQKEPACPYCGSFGAKILAGEELYLESIEE